LARPIWSLRARAHGVERGGIEVLRGKLVECVGLGVQSVAMLAE